MPTKPHKVDFGAQLLKTARFCAASKKNLPVFVQPNPYDAGINRKFRLFRIGTEIAYISASTTFVF
ncbi:hypothetical protein C6496_08880 [Candidatus Poribacteria bacterium]|nr:MAG: hypothetical protein C6496_08880 [Candidatus Poribacteria bacterium]